MNKLALQSFSNEAHWSKTVSPQIRSILELPSYFQNTPPKNTFDLAIIGGGIAGLSAACAAAEKGASVILLDRGPRLGCGASGQNAGILGAGVNMPIDCMPDGHPGISLWRDTSQLVMELYEEAKRPDSLLQAKQLGALSLAESPTAAKRLEHEAKTRNSLGLDAEIIAPNAVRKLAHGCLDLKTVHSALWLADEGRINPWTLLAQRAQDARNHGAQLFGHCNVREWQQTSVQGTPIWQINIEEFEAGSCVTSAKNASVFAKSLIVATGPIEQANMRIYAISFEVALPDDLPLFWDAFPFTYYDYRYGDGYLTVSGGRYGKADVSKNDKKFHEKMIAAARKWLPSLENQLPCNQWAVNLNVTNDMIPEINYFSKRPFASKIEGLGALGVLPGMVLGRRAAIDSISN